MQRQLLDVLKPQGLIDFRMPEEVHNSLSLLSVSRLETAWDDTGVASWGQMVFQGPAGPVPPRPSGAAILDLPRWLMGTSLNLTLPAALSAFAVCQELLDHGGDALIGSLRGSTMPDQTHIATFPHENIAVSEGREFSTAAAARLARIVGVARPSSAP